MINLFHTFYNFLPKKKIRRERLTVSNNNDTNSKIIKVLDTFHNYHCVYEVKKLQTQ